MSIDRLELSLEKAGYLFNYTTSSGKGGDKQKFWRAIMGFDSPEAIRAAILANVTIDDLEPNEPSTYGERYQAVILIEGPSGIARYVRTGWIVLAGEDVARFVTAVPERSRRQP
jgi:hypothetical protein